ncbi:hypothetical protein QBC45DRAFT_419245 [Copromyces sp. CBS 386.78]|nr:hypothetical protein QBC45DRAFT_419245 [Copromyces sp. CBS 386.78]
MLLGMLMVAVMPAVPRGSSACLPRAIRTYQISLVQKQVAIPFLDGVVLIDISASGEQALLILLIQTGQRPLDSNMGTSFAH